MTWNSDSKSNLSDEATSGASSDKHHSESEDSEISQKFSFTKFRILSSFWIFGLANSLPYYAMLTAAYDMLGDNGEKQIDGCLMEEYNKPPYKLLCHTVGTGAILLADVLPAFLVKSTAPFFMNRISYNVRGVLCAAAGTASLICAGIGGFYHIKWLSITGVGLASFDCGLGEIVFLSYSSHFDPSTMAAWSSGTGGCGIVASLLYTAMTQAGFPAPFALLIMIFVPLLQGFCFCVWIVKPSSVKGWSLFNHQDPKTDPVPDGDMERSHDSSTIALQDLKPNLPEKDENEGETQLLLSSKKRAKLTFPEMLKLLVPLQKYMIPLGIVYSCQYYINQGLIELLYFPTLCGFLKISEQYRWLNCAYQIGNFFARSSILCFKVKFIWIFPILQISNLVVLQTQVFLHYMPNNGGIWIIVVITLGQGTVAGLVYVNAFQQISTKIAEEHREFSLGIASVANDIGMVTAAFLSLFLHNKMCEMEITWS